LIVDAHDEAFRAKPSLFSSGRTGQQWLARHYLGEDEASPAASIFGQGVGSTLLINIYNEFIF